MNSGRQNRLDATFERLSEKEQRKLAALAKDGDQQARDRLMESVTPLIFRIVSEMSQGFPAHVEFDDVFQDIYLWMMGVLHKYNPHRGRFQSWVGYSIKNKILSMLALQQAHDKVFTDTSLSQIPDRLGLDGEPLVNMIDDEEIESSRFLGPDDIQLLSDIASGRTQSRTLVNLCQNHNLTWSQLLTWLTQVEQRVLETDSPLKLLAP